MQSGHLQNTGQSWIGNYLRAVLVHIPMTIGTSTYAHWYKYMWPLVHIPLTNGSCTFDQWFMYLRPLVHIPMTIGTYTFDQWYMYLWPLVHIPMTIDTSTYDHWYKYLWPLVQVHVTIGTCTYEQCYTYLWPVAVQIGPVQLVTSNAIWPWLESTHCRCASINSKPITSASFGLKTASNQVLFLGKLNLHKSSEKRFWRCPFFGLRKWWNFVQKSC